MEQSWLSSSSAYCWAGVCVCVGKEGCMESPEPAVFVLPDLSPNPGNSSFQKAELAQR